MEYLLERLNQNFDVGYCGQFENMLHQHVERLIICDKAYSILQQSDNSFEIAYADVSETDTDGIFVIKQTTVKTESNMSADQVIAFISERSNEYLLNLLNNPILSKHNISL